LYYVTKVLNNSVARCCLPQSPGQPQHRKYQNRIWWIRERKLCKSWCSVMQWWWAYMV